MRHAGRADTVRRSNGGERMSMAKAGSKFAATLILAVMLLPFSTVFVAAATVQLSGKVTDQSNNPLASATVAVIDPSTTATVASATTDTNGNYSLSVVSGI